MQSKVGMETMVNTLVGVKCKSAEKEKKCVLEFGHFSVVNTVVGANSKSEEEEKIMKLMVNS